MNANLPFANVMLIASLDRQDAQASQLESGTQIGLQSDR